MDLELVVGLMFFPGGLILAGAVWWIRETWSDRDPQQLSGWSVWKMGRLLRAQGVAPRALARSEIRELALEAKAAGELTSQAWGGGFEDPPAHLARLRLSKAVFLFHAEPIARREAERRKGAGLRDRPTVRARR